MLLEGFLEPGRGRDAYHGVRIVYLATVTAGTLRDEVDESSDRAEWATLPDLEARPVTELVKVALAWLGAERTSR